MLPITVCFHFYHYGHFILFFFFLMIRRPPRSTLFPYTNALPIWRRGTELRAKSSVDQPANFVERVVRNARGVGSHVGDEAHRTFRAKLDAFVQPLSQHHGPLHAEPKFARGLLLQRGRDERRNRIAFFLARGDDVE